MNTLLVRTLSRELRSGGKPEVLSFEPGVNVIVGRPNTGKTKWLTTLDYIMGDRDPADRVLDDLAVKYSRATAELEINGKLFSVRRDWTDPKDHAKVFVDDKPLTAFEFYALIMDRLGIPIIKYPSGDPLGRHNWFELNWRSLFRHVYRRQKYWGDLADRQPPPEQHACLLQFTGHAEVVFSGASENLAAAQKELLELQARKVQYLQVLDQVSKPLLEEEAAAGPLTPARIHAAQSSINEQLRALQMQREHLLTGLLARTTTTDSIQLEQLGERLVNMREQSDSALSRGEKTRERLAEIERYRSLLVAEADRLERAATASEALAELQITHCPACDRPIKAATGEAICHLCQRPLNGTEEKQQATLRLEFEAQRLAGEMAEANELITRLTAQSSADTKEVDVIGREIQSLTAILAPLRTRAAAILPPELALADVRLGRLVQRQRQLSGLQDALNQRDALTREIESLQIRIANLENRVIQANATSNFETSADLISDGMNEYLAQLAQVNKRSWAAGRVSLQLNAKYFQFFVDGKRWGVKLGGTLALYFLIAYHYSLLSLSDVQGCHFPGLVILDLPAEIEDAESIADRENFVLVPFIQSFKKRSDRQVIVAGSSFENLADVNRIELTQVWV